MSTKIEHMFWGIVRVPFAPITCYGVWITVPLWTGRMSVAQAEAIIENYYAMFWMYGLQFLSDLHWYWDWPDWL